MAKFNYSWDERKISKYIKEGRGSGEYEEYKPWLTVRDVPSKGRVTRLKGVKINRVHHVLSDLERSALVLFEWSNRILDIREQYPILERDKMQEISEMLGFKHPRYPNSSVNTVFTTDFLLTVRNDDGTICTVARTIKPSSQLVDQNTINKLLIEKEFYKLSGINWAIITEKELPKMLTNNLYELRNSFELISEDESMIEDVFKALVSEDRHKRIIDSIDNISKSYNIPHAKVINIFHFLVYNKKINFDLSKKINLNKVWEEV